MINRFLVFSWLIYIPAKIKTQAASCFELIVSPRKNHPKNTAAIRNTKRKGENLLALREQIAKLYSAYATIVNIPRYSTIKMLVFCTKVNEL